jgi:hypothetical protein
MSNNTLILLATAILTALIHTLTGPDHYLPFIAIARSRHYNWRKTMLWTLLCGFGHIGSALLLALLFLLAAGLLSEAHLTWFEEYRSNIAAWSLTGMGAAILLHALYARWKARPHHHYHLNLDGTITNHCHAMSHDHPHNDEKSLSYWLVFIIFVLGPCEALLPLLTAAAVEGTGTVILTTTIFSGVTILTMLGAVTLGYFGLKALRFTFLERFAAELSGATVMLCGLAILCLGW